MAKYGIVLVLIVAMVHHFALKTLSTDALFICVFLGFIFAALVEWPNVNSKDE